MVKNNATKVSFPKRCKTEMFSCIVNSIKSKATKIYNHSENFILLFINNDQGLYTRSEDI